MLLEKNSSKKSENKSQHEPSQVYSSIDDLPQWNWTMIHKTGNLAYIKKLNTYRKIEQDNSPVLEQLWLDIYNEYLEEFGISNEYKEILERKKQVAMMKSEFIITGNSSLLNFIKIEEMELENSFGKSEVMSFESVVIGIEKRQKVNLKVKEITVYEYNNYLRTLKDSKDGE